MLSYDNEQQKYLIEWDEALKQKYVSRLNLRFEEENERLFDTRLQVALQNRLFSEVQLVFSLHFILFSY